MEQAADALRPPPPGPGSDPRALSVKRIARVPVASLLPADSPRIAGESLDHIQLLTEVEGALPPILVHRPTMRVVDGMHRLRAAMLRGEREVEVEYFDGSEAEAFVHGVRANVTHGLLLSRADREAAVTRLVEHYPHWSDRAIAEIVGLSAPTVGAIRRRVTDVCAQPDSRVGRDGRRRPINSASGRRKASEFIARSPGASLREIAREAGVSLGTARDVRERMRRGEEPVPARVAKIPVTGEASARPVGAPDSSTARNEIPTTAALVLQNLRRDPSLRFSNTGRSLLQWLGVYTVALGDSEEFVRALPEHCRQSIIDLAWGAAEVWVRIARELERRNENNGPLAANR